MQKRPPVHPGRLRQLTKLTKARRENLMFGKWASDHAAVVSREGVQAMLWRFPIIAALALAMIHPLETFAKSGAVTFKVCDSDACKRRVALKKGLKLMPVVVSGERGWTSQEK